MNLSTVLNNKKNWLIEYNVYSDLFQIYTLDTFRKGRDELVEKRDSSFRILIEKDSKKPVMFEIKKAYDVLGVDVDNLSRRAIIKLIIPYFEKCLQK
ncbi:hypothetical protein HGB07_02840 [Candidatus Roizmanbacteria bacterium]|nr:hypothetical protein [Candidatus Roizmanbacteria bacterium]